MDVCVSWWWEQKVDIWTLHLLCHKQSRAKSFHWVLLLFTDPLSLITCFKESHHNPVHQFKCMFKNQRVQKLLEVLHDWISIDLQRKWSVMGKETYLYTNYVKKHPEDAHGPKENVRERIPQARTWQMIPFSSEMDGGHWFIPRVVSQQTEERNDAKFWVFPTLEPLCFTMTRKSAFWKPLIFL